MILDAAETVLGYFGFDRTVYGNKKKYDGKKMEIGTGPEARMGKRYQNRDDLRIAKSMLVQVKTFCI